MSEFIHNPDRIYRGFIEMSQDVTYVRELEGEQQLLDWEYVS